MRAPGSSRNQVISSGLRIELQLTVVQRHLIPCCVNSMADWLVKLQPVAFPACRPQVPVYCPRSKIAAVAARPKVALSLKTCSRPLSINQFQRLRRFRQVPIKILQVVGKFLSFQAMHPLWCWRNGHQRLVDSIPVRESVQIASRIRRDCRTDVLELVVPRIDNEFKSSRQSLEFRLRLSQTAFNRVRRTWSHNRSHSSLSVRRTAGDR